MFATYQLTTNIPSVRVQNQFDAVAVMVSNMTASPVVLRIGSQEIPELAAADIVVPSASQGTYAVRGTLFGVGFADATLVDAIGDSVVSGLSGVCTVAFLDRNEITPQLGSVSFLSLSQSGLQPFVAFASSALYGPYDLAPWGGLRVLVIADPGGGGQGICSIEVTDTPAGTWKTYGQWAFWPGIPLSLSIPRVARYMRVRLSGASIAGDTAISGVAAIRTSLAEISDLDATPGTANFARSVTVGSLSSLSLIYVTTGLKSITARLNLSVGTRAELVIYTSSSPAGPWSLAAFREQSVSGFYNSIVRTIGQLDAYLRLDVLDIAGGGLTGTMSNSIQQVPDQSAYLQNIFSALGDIGQPVNVNQSIYHELDTIRSIVNLIESVDLSGMATVLNLIKNQVDNIHVDTNDMDVTQLTGINTKLNSILGTDTSILGALGSGGTLHADLATLHTDLVKLLNALNNTESAFFITPVIVTAGVWQNAGTLLTPGQYIAAIQISWQIGSPYSTGFSIQFGYGTGAAVTSGFFAHGGQQPEGFSPQVSFDGPKHGGILIPAGQTNIWVQSTVAGTLINANVITRSA